MEILKQSFILRNIIKLYTILSLWIKNSLIYVYIHRLITALKKSIEKSFIFCKFTAIINKESQMNDSFFVVVLYKFIRIYRNIFTFFKLDKIFKESIFEKTHIWVGLTIALAPFLPTMVMLGMVILSIFSLGLKIGVNKEFKLRYTPVNFSVIIFFLVYMFVAITSINFLSSIKVALLIGSFIFFYFVIINCYDNKKQIKELVTIFVVIGTLISLYGVYQYFHMSYSASSWVDSEMFEDINTRVYSTFENPNVLGEYLLLVIPIAVSMFLAEKNFLKKIVWGLFSCIMVLCLALTYSRGCYLGLLCAASVFVILLNFKFIVFFIVGLILLPFILPKSILNRFTSIGNMKDSSTSYRVNIWKACVDMINGCKFVPLGQGKDVFNRIYPIFAYNESIAEHSHNLFLQIIIETGLCGILSFIYMMYRFYQYLFSGINIAKSFCDKVYLIGFVSSMFGFLVQSIFDNSWYNYRVVLIFWMFIGIATSYRRSMIDEVK